MWNQVLEGCDVYFVIDVCGIEIRKGGIDPCLCHVKPVFCYDDEYFVYNGSLFYTQTPLLFADYIIKGGLVNVGSSVHGERDVKGRMLKISDWYGGKVLEELIVSVNLNLCILLVLGYGLPQLEQKCHFL